MKAIATRIRRTLAGVLVASAVSAGLASSASATAPPAAESAPTIPSTGPPTAGTSLTAQPGSFTGAETYAYQWQTCPIAGTGECNDVLGMISTEFTPSAAEVGLYLRFVVTATNTGGPTVQRSAIIGPIGAPVTSVGSTTPATGGVVPSFPPAASRTIIFTACRSQRSETIHWSIADGVRLKRVVINVNGTTYRRLSGGARQVTVSLAGRGTGKVNVQIMSTAEGGSHYSATRSYQPCIPGTARPVVGSLYLTEHR